MENIKYIIQMQFIPGNDLIWVERLSPNDSFYHYYNEQQALYKLQELKKIDPTNRKYRIVSQTI